MACRAPPARAGSGLAVLLAAALAAPLGACAPRDLPPAGGVRFATLDPDLTRPCDLPGSLPDRDLGTAEITRLWTADRRALGLCARRQAGLVRIIEIERAGLGPAGKGTAE